jgi:hypothetical protein
MPERGSERMLKQRTISEKELERLWKLIDDQKEVRLVHWWLKGQPAFDEIYGTVRMPPAAAGSFIGALLEFDALRLRFDVFPYGVIAIDEIAVSFEQAAGVH